MSRKVIAVVSDLHAGSSIGLCPPEPVELDDGQSYVPSKFQRWLWQCWGEFWDAVEARLEGAELHALVLNGDLVDGDHHNTRQIVSRDVGVHIRLAVRCLGVPLAMKPAHVFVVRGTESHVGHSASSEEAVARILQAEGHPLVRDLDTDTGSWWQLRMDVDGVRLHFAHHGRMGYRPWTKSNAANLLAAQIFYEHAANGERHPDLAVRSHYHRTIDSYDAHPTRVIQTPCWQLRTAYVHRIVPEELPDIGGLIVTVDGDRYTAEVIRFRPERGRVWQAESA